MPGDSPLAAASNGSEAASDAQVAERRLAEQALQKQKTLLASVMENLPLGVGLYNQSGELVLFNQRMRDYAGVARLPSHEPGSAERWRGYDAQNRRLAPNVYPGARALRGEEIMPGVDFLYGEDEKTERWVRVSAVPFRYDGDGVDQAIVVVQDIDDLKRVTECVEAIGAELARQSRFLEATFSSIPDFVYAFDPQRRFAYVNRAMLALFGLSTDELLGKTLAELDYPPELADRLNRHIDRVFKDGATVEDEVFYRSPTGYAAYFAYHWGPVRAEDGSIELVVGVSRDTSERRSFEEALRKSEARLRAATDLAGLGIYSWDPITGALDWDARLREMWGLAPDAEVNEAVYEAGIHPDDLPRVQRAIAACIDPAGDGGYNIEYRVLGRDDGVQRYIATSGRTTFEQGSAIGFIGAAIDVTAQRLADMAIRTSEAQFQSFAAHSSNLIWIGDSEAAAIIYRSAAYARIWGEPCPTEPTPFAEWIQNVHPDDRQQVEHAFDIVAAGEAAQCDFRIIRPADGAVRWLRDTIFPIPGDDGAVTRIGGITEDLTQEDVHQVYIVSARAGEARKLASLVRTLGYKARTFESASEFLNIAPVLATGCVLVDLRKAKEQALSIPRELRARSVSLPTIALDAGGGDAAAAVAAMKAGATDYILVKDQASLRDTLAKAMVECHGGVRPTTTRDEKAGARVARLTPRERDVLIGLVNGGTNKIIGQKLGISPRTVELHRAQVMNRLNAGSLTELLQIALAAGIMPLGDDDKERRRAT